MSLTREITIWCDGCMVWEQRSGIKATTVRRELKYQGWVRVRGEDGMKDYCPECSKKEEAHETREEDRDI